MILLCWMSLTIRRTDFARDANLFLLYIRSDVLYLGRWLAVSVPLTPPPKKKKLIEANLGQYSTY